MSRGIKKIFDYKISHHEFSSGSKDEIEIPKQVRNDCGIDFVIANVYEAIQPIAFYCCKSWILSGQALRMTIKFVILN